MERQLKKKIEEAFELMAKAIVKECSRTDCKLQLMITCGLSEFQKSLEKNPIIIEACHQEGKNAKNELGQIRNHIENRFINK